MGELLLGIDLGTTSVKAGLFTPHGERVASFAESYPTHRPASGHCEQDPHHWLRLIDAALSQFLAKASPDAIACAAVTSQVNTHVFVGRNGNLLLPAIVWQDTRAAEEAKELDARLTCDDKIAWFGAPLTIDASHPLSRMLWVARHRPDVWENTAHVLLPKDFALLHLTGAVATDPLSNVGLVGTNGRYVPEVLALVPGAEERLAPIHGVTDVVAQTKNGIRFATATMDGWTGLIGAGACREGAYVYLSGTSEILGASSRTVTGAPGVVVFPQMAGCRLHAGPTQSGGASQQWFCNIACLTIAEMVALVERSPRRSVTPLFLPQLAGERAPLWNAGLRGAFLGLEAGMATADFARAIYEGVALSARHVLEALEASCGAEAATLLCAGGGFRSDPWGQIRADILGKPLKRHGVLDAGVVGAASIAAVAAGHADTLLAAYEPFERFNHIWEPAAETSAFYSDLFALYKEQVAAQQEFAERLTSLHIAG